MADKDRLGESWTLTTVSIEVETGDVDPEVVTQRLGLTPTGVWRPDAGIQSIKSEIGAYWLLECDDRTTRVFSEQLDEILKAAERVSSKLSELQDEGFAVALVIRGYADHDSQLLISASNMMRISRLGIPLVMQPSLSDR
ncbi:DUF4279 domain-containing protein [Streptomyces sp. PR69]|uniref:DUF4279 domain-containing protein n=1 Tax=Streptomyces sp. PR69 TaxID=2984950 RepID=UPI00226420EE|nr:DUF4279 domain-containing protein [Streptomyces sp. PR69]